MKKLLLILLLVTLCWMISAEKVEESMAIRIAEGLMGNMTKRPMTAFSVYPYMGQDSNSPDIYIVSFSPGGFVLVAGDDLSAPVLGYSTHGLFPTKEIPAHVEWYLGQYSRSMQEIRSNPHWMIDPGWNKLLRKDFSDFVISRDVAPLCATTWDQGWPYNSLCPPDASGPGGHVYAGCVATAMAQIMKKWNYPVTGNGSHSYYADGYGTQSVNFGATTYNWSLMPNSISQENIHISTLLYHCGVGVDMMYSYDGSGAYSDDARDAMVNYFRYNNAAQLHWASDYSSTIWASMLRSDLDQGRPIYYRGQNDGGHAFVLDGYQGTNYFHFNWGWSGYYDGYFYLSNLNPGSHSFTQYQGAILSLYPNPVINNDLAAVSLSGNTAPVAGTSVNYQISVSNVGQNSQSSYQVRLYRANGILVGSVSGTYIQSGQTLNFTIPWTPSTQGPETLYGKVVLSGDQNTANDNTPTLNVNVMEAGLLVVQVGDGTAINGNTGSPTPYGTWYKAFRQQYLYRADEIYAAGGASGLIKSIAFNVMSVDDCTPMTNYQIRLKHSGQTALGSTFEAGGYEVVFQANTFMPVEGWNLHVFDVPFFWNGTDNLIVEAVTDLCAGSYARNALVYYSSPGFNSSLRFQSDSAHGSTGTSGTVSANRSNARFFMIVDDMGSMSGTVTADGTPLGGATIWVEGTSYSATSLANGFYSIPYAPVGYQTVSATKQGYGTASHNVNIMAGQNTVQNFALSASNLPPQQVEATVAGNNVHVTWQAPGSVPPPDTFTDGFEIYTDFALTFDPWVTVDMDQSGTYGMTGVSWPNAYAAQAYIIFNPSATTPAVADLSAHGGSKMAACFAATSSVNNDWLISPILQPQTGQSFNFWARSYTAQYGLERFKVGVSNGGTAPANFTIITTGNYVSAPVDWALYSYDLSAYAGQEVRVGIQCVSDDAFFFLVDDVSFGGRPSHIYQGPYAGAFMGDLTRSTGIPVPGIPSTAGTRDLLGYKVYRDGVLINTINNAGILAYDDLDLDIGTYSYTVSAVYANGESEPAGPATVTIGSTLDPPANLTADVEGRDVTLNWESPEAPQQGEWITWCNDVLGNSIGTGSAATFAVAHRFTQADLASVAGGTISQLRFVPNEQNCVYTAKVWTGGSASNAGTLVSSQVVSNPIMNEWNTVVLNTPVPIPNTGDVYIGYEAATQTGYPAGCDAGPPIEGKGNMMYFQGEWDTLSNIASTLTYNWLIQTFVATGTGMKNIALTPIVEAPQITHTYAKADFDVLHKDIAPSSRAVSGFKVYRDNVLIATLNDPNATTYTELEVPNGTYIYGVSAIHAAGESAQATIQVTVDLQMAEVVFADDFESHANFATMFAPWTLMDIDASETYGFSDVQFPNSSNAMAYIIFNPSATVPPMTGLDPHAGSKMAASFAAIHGPNNDWLITPRIQLGTNSAIRFYARSHTAVYGLERFRVGVSFLPNIIQQGFQWINGAYSEAPTNWTEYIFDLSAYDNQSVYIAIRCISDDAFVFYVDDFSVHSDGSSTNYQNIPLQSGWNLISLNVSPPNHSIATLISPIATYVQQIKSTEGVYIPGNPYSNLTSLSDGKAYSIQMSSSANWQVQGTQIPPNTPIPLSNGWNMVAYLPQTQMNTGTAMSSISAWLQQVKGSDGVYIPNNPYNTLNTLYPGKGYWIKISGNHSLIYPNRGSQENGLAGTMRREELPEVTLKPNSAVILARCDIAEVGDILLARVGQELRGAEVLIAPESFPAALIQIYCEEAGEQAHFSILKPDGQELPLVTSLELEPGQSYGTQSGFIILEPQSVAADDILALETTLKGSYPNPFNPSTTIKYDVAADNTPVTLTIYNIKGQRVCSLIDARIDKGSHTVVWNGTDDKGKEVSSGIYFVTMKSPGITKTHKLLLSK